MATFLSSHFVTSFLIIMIARIRSQNKKARQLHRAFDLLMQHHLFGKAEIACSDFNNINPFRVGWKAYPAFPGEICLLTLKSEDAPLEVEPHWAAVLR